jgi:aminopeptidase N
MIGVAMKIYEGLIGMLVTLLPIGAPSALGHPPGGELEPGISRELATWRAEHYRDLRYVLKLGLVRPFERLRGELLIVVTVDAPAADLVLDWRPGEGAGVSDLRVNGVTPDVVASARDHLVIPEALLQPGENRIELRFDATIRASGTAVTRFRDSQDQTDYLYTLLVPADASSLFPCFDQPDLKARFELTAIAPSDWRVIGNAPELEITSNGEMATTCFAATEPISTYLFAFAAGHFAELKDRVSGARLFVRRSRLERARQEADEVLRLTRQSEAYFADYFAQPFPFAKYDLVLIPELAYGGMEHAGATFLREDSVLFPFQPAAADRLRRAQLIFHETAHQWFGDLVTMRWFDDLWLKEGFANFMAAKATAALLPEFDAWNAFRALKTAAYRTDATRGTTPIWQSLPNLAGAKSAYGNIVYSKAPAVLRQAEFFLGEEVFRSAVREFTARYAFRAADWSDLVGALERSSGRNLQSWADAWVKRRGLPAVRVSWDVDAEGRLSQVALSQRDALGEGGVWPMRVQLVVVDADGKIERLQVVLEGESVRVRSFEGRPAPQFVFANDGDFGYGLFLLDERSRAALLEGIGGVRDPFLRALLWDALWESVREAELPPLDYIAMALRELPQERDEVTVSGILARVQTAFRWYLSDGQQTALAPRLESALRAEMLGAPQTGLRIICFRAFAAVATSGEGRADLERLLSGQQMIPGVMLSSNDRFRVIRRLLTLNDAAGERLLAEQSQADRTDDGLRQAYAAGAARPDAATKRDYFDAFMSNPQLAERWIEDSLPPFNAVEQETLTLAFLEPALRALPELKRRHRIFFVNDWLAAFVGGQRSAGALSTVEKFLAQPGLEPDLRLKLLEAVDGLERTVKIRGRYSN